VEQGDAAATGMWASHVAAIRLRHGRSHKRHEEQRHHTHKHTPPPPRRQPQCREPQPQKAVWSPGNLFTVLEATHVTAASDLFEVAVLLPDKSSLLRSEAMFLELWLFCQSTTRCHRQGSSTLGSNAPAYRL